MLFMSLIIIVFASEPRGGFAIAEDDDRFALKKRINANGLFSDAQSSRRSRKGRIGSRLIRPPEWPFNGSIAVLT
jgi:hypothetical protein